jgi:ferrous iron transport protein B
MPGLVLFCMYLLGFILAPLVALLLKRTLLRGAAPIFVMELPAYKRPTLRGILHRVWDAGFAFVYRAGTVIVVAMILVWAALYFPHTDANGTAYEDRIEVAEKMAKPAAEEIHRREEAKEEVTDELKDTVGEPDRIAVEWKRNSLLGKLGLALEPAFEPLGWDWRIGMAAIASFPAREVVVGTLGILYSQGEVKDEEQRKKLGDEIRDDWSKDAVRGKYAIPVGLSIMVFFALCMQCASTLAVIRRETRSWLWPAFTFAYMTALAYVGAFVTFQVGKLIVG